MDNYVVVAGHDIPSLTKKVNKMIELGWKVSGGISCETSDIAPYYYQGMVKKEKDEISEETHSC